MRASIANRKKRYKDGLIAQYFTSCITRSDLIRPNMAKNRLWKKARSFQLAQTTTTNKPTCLKYEWLILNFRTRLLTLTTWLSWSLTPCFRLLSQLLQWELLMQETMKWFNWASCLTMICMLSSAVDTACSTFFQILAEYKASYRVSSAYLSAF